MAKASGKKNSDSIALTFAKDRETKNTIRYNENVDGDNAPVVGVLYVRKSAASNLGNPDSLSVVITVA